LRLCFHLCFSLSVLLHSPFFFLLSLEFLFHFVFIALFLHCFSLIFLTQFFQETKLNPFTRGHHLLVYRGIVLMTLSQPEYICCVVIHLHRMRWYETEGEHTTSFSWGAVQLNVSSIYCVSDSVCTCDPNNTRNPNTSH
jgi:hypothetical protein